MPKLYPDEPRLKYKRFGGAVGELLEREEGAAIACSKSFIAIGTKEGRVYHFTPGVQEVQPTKQYHRDCVTHVHIDPEETAIVSAGMDGKVIFHPLSSMPPLALSIDSPVTALALSPEYDRFNRSVAVGTAGGFVSIFSERKLLGHREHKIHSGDSAIQAVAWCGRFVAFADTAHVIVYDSQHKAAFTFIDAPAADSDSLTPCRLVWESPCLLLIAWGDTVMAAYIHGGQNDPAAGVVSPMTRLVKKALGMEKVARNPGAEGEAAPHAVQSDRPTLITAELVTRFSTATPHYFISAIAPFRENLFLLGVPDTEHAAQLRQGRDPARTRPDTEESPSVRGSLSSSLVEYVYTDDDERSYPCVVITTLANQEVSGDRLPVRGWKKNYVTDYRLSMGTATDARTFYILAPHDLVLAQEVSEGDHCIWLCKKQQFNEALAEAKRHKSSISSRLYLEIMEACACGLLAMGERARSAKILSEVLPVTGPERERRWERWLFVFAAQGAIMEFVPYIPGFDSVGAPDRKVDMLTLSETAWGTILAAYLASSHEKFAQLLDACSSLQLTNPLPIIAAVVDRYRRFPHDQHLIHALATLYDMNSQFRLAFAFMVRSRNPLAFEYSEKHGLREEALRHAGELFQIDAVKASQFFKGWAYTEVKEIIRAIVLAFSANSTNNASDVKLSARARIVLHNAEAARPLILFLTEVAKFDKLRGLRPRLTEQQESTLVHLVAMHEPSSLRTTLDLCRQVPLEVKKNACKENGRVDELVTLLRRENSLVSLGEALDAILESGRDECVDDAVRFVWGVQSKHNLWDRLAEKCAQTTSIARLLELVCAGSLPVDPKKIVELIKDELEIEQLSALLTRIVADADVRHRLHVGCGELIKDDTVELGFTLFGSAKRGVVVRDHTCNVCSSRIIGDDPRAVTVGFNGNMFHDECRAQE